MLLHSSLTCIIQEYAKHYDVILTHTLSYRKLAWTCMMYIVRWHTRQILTMAAFLLPPVVIAITVTSDPLSTVKSTCIRLQKYYVWLLSEMPWMEIPSPDGSSSGTELEPTLNADSIKLTSTLPCTTESLSHRTYVADYIEKFCKKAN